MITRLTHAAIAFAVTAALYQAYVLTVAPLVEPAWTSSGLAAAASDLTIESGVDSLAKYRELLAAYFPPDHWCFARPPKTMESGQALIVFDDYTQSSTGEVRVPLCAVVFFPKVRDRGAPPPRDAIILESTGGAMLQLEQALDKGVNGLGRLQFGQLQGEVTVRSDMREPGPQDDLRLVTRDLYMNEDLIHTTQPVDLKLGEHHAYGRELEIRRLKADRPRDAGMAGLYGSFEDLVLKHDVSMTIAPGNLRLGDAAVGAKPSATADLRQATGAKANGPDPKLVDAPIRIKSAGPFRIDFGSYAASFNDQVQVRQLHPDGKLDELLATELKLFFTKTTKWNAGDDGVSPTPGDNAADQSFALEPASFEAFGTAEAPVVLTAPSYGATARGEHLWIELGPRRITLERGEEVMLTYNGAEIHGPMVQYELPPKDSGQRIGALRVRNGAGWLRAIIDPARPSEVVEVTWKDAMQIVRAEGQPVIVLDGRPTVSMVGTGKLWADQLQLFLRELPSDQVNPASPIAGPASSSITPELIKASGRVTIESSQLMGKVNQLDVKFHPTASGPASNGGPTGPGGPAAQSPLVFGGVANGGAQRAYDITGVTLKVDVALRDHHPAVQGINVDGGVVFQESSPGAAGEAPMRITAEHLAVAGADTPNAQIEIRGGGGQNGLPLQLAEINGRGARLRAPAITLNRGTSRAWINSPGELQMLVDRDMTGNPLPRPEPMTVVWQQSMQLEGQRTTFLGDVRVENTSGWLRTRRLVVQTKDLIRFDGATGQQAPQLEQLECWEGAVAEFEQRDVSGVSSRQHVELQSILVNQLTGAVSGDGPGKIDSVHLSKNTLALLALPGSDGAPPAPGLVNANPELRHLHVDFVRGVTGDLRTRTVKVLGDVHAVYGPVANWDDRLVMTPGGSPKANEVWITCDSLGVTESPLVQLGNAQAKAFELMAEGRVYLEGYDPKQGRLYANGHRAKVDQAKGIFILEGDGITPATLEQRQYENAPASPQSAQKFQYNRNTGTFEVQGLHKGGTIQIDPTRPRGTAPGR